MWRTLAATALCSVAFAAAAQAEVTEVRMSKQFGLPYLPMIVIEAQQLIEKNAKAAGLGDVKTTWTQRAGPAAELDALLAGQADFIGPGVPTLATIWDKTTGTPSEARALIAMQSMPYVLVTRNPNVKTIADFTDKDKIALPAVKLTGHAIALEIEAAKIWGPEHYDKLNSITITRSHADAAAALMSGRSEIDAHFASSPFYYYELATPGIHQVLKSYDVVGGSTPTACWWRPRNSTTPTRKCARGHQGLRGSQRFHQGAPARCGGDLPDRNAATRTRSTRWRRWSPIPDVDYTTTPVNVMKIVDFMYKVGRLKKKPNSWKDMFFPEAYGLNGS